MINKQLCVIVDSNDNIVRILHRGNVDPCILEALEYHNEICENKWRIAKCELKEVGYGT